jgi:hypothetical protein
MKLMQDINTQGGSEYHQIGCVILVCCCNDYPSLFKTCFLWIADLITVFMIPI